MNSRKFALGGAVALAAVLAGVQMMQLRSNSPDSSAGTAGCAVEAPDAVGCLVVGVSPDQVVSSQASAARPSVMEAEVGGGGRGGSVSEADRGQLRILNEVLASRNDNDPRLDRELRVLSPGARKLLRARYDELAAEKRNERGTIVFLVGRNLEGASDFKFLSEVVNEAPCRSLKDCQAADAMDSRDATGAEMGIDVTLNYPQIVALRSLERLLAGAPSPTDDQKQEAIKVIREAMGSPVRVISGLATDLYNRFGGKSS